MFKVVPESLVIILFNIVPILGVAYYNWAPFEVFWLFWMETLIIAFFNAIRVLYSQGLEQPTETTSTALKLNFKDAAGYLLVRIFVFFFYALFIIVFIGVLGSSTTSGVKSLAVIFFANKLFNIALLLTLLSQSFYLIKYFFMNGAYRFSKPGEYSALFDSRQIVIHVAVVLGAVGSSFLFKEGNQHTALWVIGVFCLVKCIVELYLVSNSKNPVIAETR
jgi:hypothetical protein